MVGAHNCHTCRYNDWKYDAMNCQMCRGHNQWVSKELEDDIIDYDEWAEEQNAYNDRQNYN